jgi:hypothetical protein
MVAGGGIEGGPIEGGPIENLLTVDVGQFSTLSTEPWQVPGTRVALSSGTQSTSIQLRIIRPPLATAGALTIPALPTVIIYAPPLGPDKKNSATYSSTLTISNKIATTVTNSNSTKTSTAYSTTDFIDKISGFLGDLSNVATTVLSGGAATPTVLGSFLSLLGLSTGGSSGASTAATDLKYISTGLKSVQDVLDGLVSSNTQNTTQLTTTSGETDLTTTFTVTQSDGTEAGQGPGVGDRIGMLLNVRIAWAIINNELNITVLGYDGSRIYSVQNLGADLQLLASGKPLSQTQTNLDANTIQGLLTLDPLVPNAAVPKPDASVLVSPRFVANIDDPSIGGDGNATSGDLLTVSHNVTTADIQTTTNVTTHVTDFKPGWMTALFGDNTAIENQASMTYSNGTTLTVGTTITSGVTLFATTGVGTNMIAVYFDNLFKTFVFLPYILPS